MQGNIARRTLMKIKNCIKQWKTTFGFRYNKRDVTVRLKAVFRHKRILKKKETRFPSKAIQ